MRVEPNSLSQYQQLNSTSIQGMMMPPNSLGTGLEFLKQALNEVAPSGFSRRDTRANPDASSRKARYSPPCSGYPWC